jgi:hypothetical protein
MTCIQCNREVTPVVVPGGVRIEGIGFVMHDLILPLDDYCCTCRDPNLYLQPSER